MDKKLRNLLILGGLLILLCAGYAVAGLVFKEDIPEDQTTAETTAVTETTAETTAVTETGVTAAPTEAADETTAATETGATAAPTETADQTN